MLNRKQIFFFSAAIFTVLLAVVISKIINSMNIRSLANGSNNNVTAFLKVIRYSEGTAGTNGYRTMFGGSLFTSYAKHPNKAITGGGYTSTAAGAYQFLYRTWAGLAIQLGLTDFSPANQDIAAVELLRQRKALDAVIAGDFKTAVHRCAPEWASLPVMWDIKDKSGKVLKPAGKSYYGQPVRAYATIENIYKQAGGQLA